MTLICNKPKGVQTPFNTIDMKNNIDRLKSLGNTILNLITSIQETDVFMKEDSWVKPNIELEEDKRVLLLGLDNAFECFTAMGDNMECDIKTKNILNLANALQECCNETYGLNNQKNIEELQKIKNDFEDAIFEY